MYGAIIGDLAGSIYEYDQLKKVKPINISKLITDESFFSDDTILTIAVIDAIINQGDYEEYLKKYIIKYQDYKPNFTPYFSNSFSKRLLLWLNDPSLGNSIGNGAMMRVSPIGYLFNNINDVREQARLLTCTTHNSSEAITCATIIAEMIFLLRNGYSKEDVYKLMKLNIEYKPFLKFNTTCYETIGNCLYAFYYSNSFIDAIKNIIKMGGDTDTNACIVGSLAEALYPINNSYIEDANNHLPKEFVKVLKMVY